MCGVPVFHSAGCLSDELRRTADSTRRPESISNPKTAIPPDENDPRMFRSKERHTANNGKLFLFDN